VWVAKEEREEKKQQDLEAKEAARAGRQAAAEAAARRKARVDAIGERLRRSRCWCTCNSRLEHRQNCQVVGASGQTRWFGADMGVSREDLSWYYVNGGRLGAAAKGHGIQNIHSQSAVQPQTDLCVTRSSGA
jgi:hypothetical protein